MNSNFIQHGYIARTPIHTLSLSLSLYVSLSLFSPMYTLSLSRCVFSFLYIKTNRVVSLQEQQSNRQPRTSVVRLHSHTLLLYIQKQWLALVCVAWQ